MVIAVLALICAVQVQAYSTPEFEEHRIVASAKASEKAVPDGSINEKEGFLITTPPLPIDQLTESAEIVATSPTTATPPPQNENDSIEWGNHPKTISVSHMSDVAGIRPTSTAQARQRQKQYEAGVKHEATEEFNRVLKSAAEFSDRLRRIATKGKEVREQRPNMAIVAHMHTKRPFHREHLASAAQTIADTAETVAREQEENRYAWKDIQMEQEEFSQKLRAELQQTGKRHRHKSSKHRRHR